MSASIFISFASQDHRVAMTLCQALETRGFKCWISSRDIQPGENFQVAIVRAIRQAKIMLLVFTNNSNNSEEMNKELALASQSKLIVVPLRIEDVTPNEAFAYEFATRQWIDFFADWEFAIQQLSQRIESATHDEPPEASRASPARAAPPVLAVEPPAPEPEGAAVALAKRLKISRKLPAKLKPAEKAAPLDEIATFEDEPILADSGEATAPNAGSMGFLRARRTAVYVGISLIVLIVAGIGIAPSLMKPKAAQNEPRAMAMLPVAPPSNLQRVSAPSSAPAAVAATPPADAALDAAAPPADPALDAAPKAPTHKKKAKAAVATEDVPY
jgi:hypothetical protein